MTRDEFLEAYYLGRRDFNGAILGLTMRLEASSLVEARANVGGKLGTTSGLYGSFILSLCPASRWLVDCAQTIGLGSRTAYGFGRITVETVA